MTGGGDHLAVVIAPETAEEANHVATALRAGGFDPVIDYGSIADRLGNFPVLVPQAELGEAKGFLRGLRAGQSRPTAVVPADPAPVAAPAPARQTGLAPLAGRALALLTGLLVLAGGVAVLTNMLQFLNSLRDH